MTDTPEIEYSVVEAATLAEVDVHPNTIDKAIRTGELAFRWKRGRRLIRRTDLLAWSAGRRRRPVPSPSPAEVAAS